MKKFLFALLIVISANSITEVFAKTLVVYYSLTGTTQKLAHRIANETKSDIFELELKNPYSTNGNKCSEESKADYKNNVRRELKSLPKLSEYDTVFIGSPVWSNNLANPVETFIFLSKDELSKKTIIPFCTYWSTGNNETLEAIKKLCGSSNTKKGISQAHGKTADLKELVK